MKKYFLTINLLSIILLFANCKKDKLEFADKSIIVNNSPNISVYKTNNDYYNYVVVKLDSLGNITQSPAYCSKNDPRVTYQNGNKGYAHRWKLKSGYIVDKGMWHDKIFTDISIQEFIEYADKNNICAMPDSILKQRIIDTNPFQEYYWLDGLFGEEYQEFTLGEINEMIENGTLETVFTKIK